MADRARGTRGTPRGRAQAPRGRGTSSRGDRNNGPRGGGAGSTIQSAPEAKKKENILDLNKYIDKEICVRFNGGREATGTLKGYDQLMNLVLDNVRETTRDDEGNESSRKLGLLVARGTLIVLISPVDGSEQIANPFLQAEDE